MRPVALSARLSAALDGGAGSDYLNGEDGNDQFNAADGAVDALIGAAATDTDRLSTDRDSNDSVLYSNIEVLI